MSISVILAAIVGFLAARMLWLAVRNSWTVPALLRRNYRGMQLPTAAGIIIPLSLLLVEGLRAIFGAIGIGEDGGFSPVRAAGLIIIVGFATLGLLDDLLGNSTKAKGLAGHIKALRQGEFTTGSLKLLGGIALALIAASMVNAGNVGSLIIDGAVIALAANLGNLLDLRPGRTTKISVIAFVILAIVSGLDSSLIPVAIAVGAAVALFLDEMHERLMLGDTGANALGAMLGLGIVTTTGTSGALIAAVVLILLTVVGDTVGFTKIFDKVAPLRAFDALGRKNTSSQSQSRASNYSDRITAPAAAQQPSAPQTAQPEYEPEVVDEEIDLNQYEDEYEDDDEELSLDEIEDDELEPEPFTRSTIDVREEPVAQAPAPQQATRVVPPSPPRAGMAAPSNAESSTSETRATLGNGNAGATASSFTTREPRPFSSPRTGDASPTRGRYDDEFEDTPDFFTPRRPSQPQSPQSSNEQVEQRPLSDRFHSPFDDDEEEF